MNYRILFKLLSVIMSTVAIAFLVSYAVGGIFFWGRPEQEVQDEWWLCIAIAGLLAVLFRVLGMRASPKIFRKEGLAIIGLGWILASLVGALPYALCVPEASVADAIFESTSGLTTTGASVISDIESMPHSILFWRCLSQWIGGLGVVVFFVSLLSFLGAGAKILYSNESSGHSTDIESGRIQKGVIQIIWLYLILSAFCATAYRLGGMNWFDAVCHMFATIATGGFANYNAGFGAFQSPLLEWIAIVFMILGGTSFFFMIRICVRRNLGACKNTEVAVYYAIAVFVSLLITVIVWWHEKHIRYTDPMPFMDALRTGTFQVVSIMTTTGFTTVDYQQWLPVTHTILLGLMIIGGCSGSTAGGIKVVRMVVAIKVSLRQIEQAFRSHVVRPIRMNGRVLDNEDQDAVLRFLLLYTLICVAALPIISVSQVSLSFEGSIATLFACFFNIGPGFAEVGPAANYDFMSPFTKLFLSLLMILGRLELYAVLVLFAPSLWRKFH